jgi:hypothetical protein
MGRRPQPELLSLACVRPLRYGVVVLALTLLKLTFEVGELRLHGLHAYVRNVYNLIDIAAVGLLLQMTALLVIHSRTSQLPPASLLFGTFGYFDNYEYAAATAALRSSASFVLCLQLLKGTQCECSGEPSDHSLAVLIGTRPRRVG